MTFFKSPLSFMLTAASVLFLVIASFMTGVTVILPIVAVVGLALLHFIFNRSSTRADDEAMADFFEEREKSAVKNAVKNSFVMGGGGRGGGFTMADTGSTFVGRTPNYHGALILWIFVLACYVTLAILATDRLFGSAAAVDMALFYPFLFAVLMMASAEVAGEIRSPKLKKIVNILMAVLIAVGLVFFIYGLIALPR